MAGDVKYLWVGEIWRMDGFRARYASTNGGDGTLDKIEPKSNTGKTKELCR